MANKKMLNGAEILLQSLKDCGVDTIFGYPGGAVLPIYDAIYNDEHFKHILVRHEQGAAHAAEGYARSTGKLGVILVTSGPGVTNAITGLTDALLDSVPVLCISGQVPTALIGTDAFQEADATGLTRSCTKHNYLVKDVNEVEETVKQGIQIATTGRPGPVLIDFPKDIQLAKTEYNDSKKSYIPSYHPKAKPDLDKIQQAIDLMENAVKPVFYTGGGIINSGAKASKTLVELVKATGFPITNTLLGLGAYPGEDEQFLGMLGMHGTYEANMAMHGCDVLINIGARFDDRVTGRIEAFAPFAKKIHIDIDQTSIDKNIAVDIGIIGDAAEILLEMKKIWDKKSIKSQDKKLKPWWDQINTWREKDSLGYIQDNEDIKPQYAIDRLYQKIKEKDFYITTEVGQHQMWAAQYIKFPTPHRFMTSGGLGTMGYGLPAAVGVQVAHPDSLVIDVAGEASIQMTMQEISTAVQYNLPLKVFIINNKWMGMVRQWQELNHGCRYSESYSDALPDFVKLAEAYGAKGLRAEKLSELDGVIDEMIAHKGPVIVDILVTKQENCFPMIPSGAAHNEMILNEDPIPETSEEGLAKV